MAEDEPPRPDERDVQVHALIKKYTWLAAGGMVIPVPGADVAATFAVWGKMIADIAIVYGYRITLSDATKLAAELFDSAVRTSVMWFATGKVASTALKLIPFIGQGGAFVIDSALAALGAKKITAGVGTAAAVYFKSGRTQAATMNDVVKRAMGDLDRLVDALTLVRRVENLAETPEGRKHEGTPNETPPESDDGVDAPDDDVD